ncbi:MAG: amidase family protein [Spirochaetaceae bacterium]
MWNNVLNDPARREAYAEWAKERDEEIGSFLEFDPDRGVAVTGSLSPGELYDPETDSDEEREARRSAAERIKELPFGIKDNIALRNFKLTCGSRMLEPMLSPYSATAVERLLAAGAHPVGKTNMDEFGMGSSTDNSALRKTTNPWDATKVPGGSSGGSAAAVAAGIVPFALGSDTGGSIRQPANFCGVYGLKPTYGSVSRYGLVAYASSLEGIGVVAESVELCEDVFTVIRGRDALDHSSLAFPRETGRAGAAGGRAERTVERVGILGGDLGLSEGVKRGYERAIEVLKEQGYEVAEVPLPMLDYVVPAYYTIATAEASANLARFTGVRYGYRPDYAENPEQLVRKARSEAFGEEVKLRILLGTYVLRSGFQDQYYLRAQKIRTAIRKEFDNVFTQVGAIMMPVSPVQPFAHGERELDSFQQKLADKFTSTANLTGSPALAIPTGTEGGMPVGVQIMAPAFAEARLFEVARRFGEAMPLQRAPKMDPFEE